MRDTGVGMDDRTRQHVFEPFFTTKSVSKGTGLGLATVFGVVTQAGGTPTVTSEPGHGSAFSLYFPRHRRSGERRSSRPAPTPAPPRGGRHRAGGGRPGRMCGVWRVLILATWASTFWRPAMATQALALAAALRRRPIRLMLTDVIMPGMNGQELADADGCNLRPQTKVIFMSGYTDRIMSRDGVLDDSVAYLQKPFTAEQLTATLRRVLE